MQKRLLSVSFRNQKAYCHRAHTRLGIGVTRMELRYRGAGGQPGGSRGGRQCSGLDIRYDVVKLADDDHLAFVQERWLNQKLPSAPRTRMPEAPMRQPLNDLKGVWQ